MIPGISRSGATIAADVLAGLPAEGWRWRLWGGTWVAGALYFGTMSKATEPTLHDVLRELRALRADHGARLGGIGEHLEGIDGRLASHGEHLEGMDGRLASHGEHLEGIDGRLASHGEHLEGIDGRLASHGEHLEGIDGRLASHGEHLEGIDARMDSLEHSVTEVLGDGLANVQAAVENFAATKADRTELEAVRADVDALKEAAG